MPAKADFEEAAEKLFGAAQQVGDLAVAAQKIDVSSVLRGGSLGHMVPERIAAAAAAARSCQTLISTAEATCRERAQIIADYEDELEIYDRALDQYKADDHQWWVEYWYWVDGVGYHPGDPPIPPTPPNPPPAWADVRRL